MAPSIGRLLILLSIVTLALFLSEPTRTLATGPTPSDADPPYPLNHTFGDPIAYKAVETACLAEALTGG